MTDQIKTGDWIQLSTDNKIAGRILQSKSTTWKVINKIYHEEYHEDVLILAPELDIPSPFRGQPPSKKLSDDPRDTISIFENNDENFRWKLINN